MADVGRVGVCGLGDVLSWVILEDGVGSGVSGYGKRNTVALKHGIIWIGSRRWWRNGGGVDFGPIIID
jgi:hypothetical protein